MRLVLIFLLLAVGPLVCPAGAAGEPVAEALPALPDLPADGIHDQARLLDAAARGRLAESMARFEESRELRIGIAAFTLTPGPDTAARLCQQWFGGSDKGLVIVYLRDQDALLFSEQRLMEEWLDPVTLHGIFTDARKAVAALPRDMDGRDALLIMEIGRLVERLASDESAGPRSSGSRPAEVMRQLGMVATATVLLALPVWLVIRSGRFSLSRRQVERKFPEVTVPVRLGGAFSGGTGATTGHRARKK